MTIRYRPEIDGLRTVAVLSVIVYHAEFVLAGHNVLSGGFFGVDVFFVISGYLITSLILGELNDSGTFSVARFYERRARRLLPALLVVMAFSVVASWHILLPAQLVDFSRSLIASLAFLSNVYWVLSLQEYGAESALFKPMLHTWSLAVEEQYYLFFPLVMLAAHRWLRQKLNILLFGGLLISLAFAVWFTSFASQLSFYMLPSRLWELLAGGLLASIRLRCQQKDSSVALDNIMPIAGLLLLAYSFSVVEYDSNHPGLVTLIPVLGTLLIIWFSGKGDVVTSLLSSRVFVGIGLLSYSLYLWHYPIFAFARDIKADISLTEKLIWIVLTFILSAFSYVLVEKPCRNRQIVSTKRFLGISSALFLLVISFSGYALYNDGIRDRFQDLETSYGINEFDNKILREKSWSLLNGLANRGGYDESVHNRPSRFESEMLWFTLGGKKTNVLIIGNSVSKDLFNALYQNAGMFPASEFARFGMDAKLKEDQISSLFASPNYVHADIVVVKFLLEQKSMTKLTSLLVRLKNSGKRVYLASNPAAFKDKGDTPLFDWYMQEHGNPGSHGEDLRRLFFEYRIANSRGDIDTNLRQLAQKLDIPFLNFWDLVCHFDEETCDGLTTQGYKSFFDGFHWTLQGARHFGTRISKLGWMELR